MKARTMCMLCAALGVALALPATAQVRISGFGQVVASHQSGDGAYPLLGYDDGWSMREESIFAVQLSADLNEKFSATAQILAQGRDSFEPTFAWAYLSWQASDNLSFKFGRQRLPFFTYSDYLDVGYAYPWVRPNMAVYNFIFLRDIDAVSATWSTNSGAWDHELSLMLGKYSGTTLVAGVPSPSKLENTAFAAWEASYDSWLNLRVGYGRTDATTLVQPLESLFNVLDTLGLSTLRAALDLNEDLATFAGLGVNVEHGNWWLGAERTRVTQDKTFQPQRNEWHAYAGYRFGTVMPYLSVGHRDARPRDDIAATVPATLPPPLRNGILGLLNSTALDDTYTSVGVRWDFMKNIAFKFEYAQFRSDLVTRPDADLLSTALVFTF
jgi:hypothetical protein